MERSFSIAVGIAAICSSIIAASVGFTDGRLYEGLENCAPEDLPQQMHALVLPKIDPWKNPGTHPPITDDVENEKWFIDGKLANDLTRLEESLLYDDVFPNEEFVYLPPKAIISRSSYAESPLHWIYPDGMTFFHQIKVKKFENEKESFFELRVLKRINGRWAFGVYSRTVLGPCGGDLELRKIPVNHIMAITAYRQKKIEYRAKPLDPRSCVDCHGMGEAERQGVRTREIGPCKINFIETLEKGIDHPLFGKSN